MYIETNRLIVRTFRESDTDALYRIKTDPQVMYYCPDLLDVEVQLFPTVLVGLCADRKVLR